MKRFIFIAVFLLPMVFVVIPFNSSAQILIGENFPITTSPGFQSAPAIAANPSNGEFLAVWHKSLKISDDPPSFKVEIWGQRISSDGLIGQSFLVTSATASNPALGGSNPAATYNSQRNEYLVVYGRGYFGSINDGIFGQRVGADGSLIGGEITIFQAPSQASAAIAYNSISNQYLVVWGQSVGEVHGQLINDTGIPVGSTFLLTMGLAGAGNAAVAFNSTTNQYLVVWDAFASYPSIADVFGRIVNSNGSFAGPYFKLTNADEIQAFPSVAFDPLNNRYFVTWWDNRNPPGGDIFGQLVAADGSLIGENVAVSTFPFNEGAPSVSYTSLTNQYLVVWVGQPSSGPPVSDVFGVPVGSDGIPQGDAFQVSSAGSAEFFTALAINSETNVSLCAWPDERNYSTSDVDIFGQLITVTTLPPVATLVSPSGTIYTTTPTYTWNAVSNSTRYYLRVNDSTGNRVMQWYRAADAGCASGTGTCSVTPTTVLKTGTGTWWVQTWNPIGYGSWSNGMSFTVSPPGVATLLSPTGTITTTTPTYAWNAVPGSTWYYLWVNDFSGNKIKQWYTAAQANCPTGTGACSVTPTTGVLGSCKWWVQTYSSVGYGPWSAPLSFTAPGQATLISPSGTITIPTPTYTWNAVTGSTWYYLWVNDFSGNKIKQWYTAAQANCPTGTGTCNVTPTTEVFGSCQWWIQTWKNGIYGPWSASLSFTAPIPTPPGPATLVSPSGTTTTTPTYTWNAVTGSTWYYLWVNDSSGNRIQQWYTAAQANCPSGTSTCSVTPATVLALGTGAWWIQTYNSLGYGPWSSRMDFTVQ